MLVARMKYSLQRLTCELLGTEVRRMACSKGSAKTRLNQLGTIMVSPLQSTGFQHMDYLIPTLSVLKPSEIC
jgi:hypothetical protein